MKTNVKSTSTAKASKSTEKCQAIASKNISIEKKVKWIVILNNLSLDYLLCEVKYNDIKQYEIKVYKNERNKNFQKGVVLKETILKHNI